MATRRQPPLPAQYISSLLQLLHLPVEVVDVLIVALEDASPVAKESDLLTQIASKTKLDPDDIQAILRVVMGLYTAPSALDVSVPDFVKGVIDELRHTETNLGEIAEEQWERLSATLNRLLWLDNSLGVRAKTQELMTEQEHIFFTARVITDMRPVFSKDLASRPVAAAVFHTLKITYGEAGQVRQFFVALDDKDVQELREDLARAEEKSKSLKIFLDEGKLPYLEVEDIIQ